MTVHRAAVATPDPDPDLRRVLLQRLANDLAVARALSDGQLEGGCWSCCWLTYSCVSPPGRLERRLHRLCARDCPHWHHQTEVFLA